MQYYSDFNEIKQLAVETIQKIQAKKSVPVTFGHIFRHRGNK